MSSIIMCRFDDRIEVLTDGGHYNYDTFYENYVLSGVRSKTVVLPHINTVLASVGSADFLPNMVGNCEEQWTSFDALLEWIKENVSKTYWHLKKFWPNRSMKVCIVFGGYSVERDRWETYSIECINGEVSEPIPQKQTCCIPDPSPEDFAKVGIASRDGGNNINLTSLLDVMLLVQAQRLHKGPMGSSENPPEGHAVGAHAQYTIVRRDYFTSAIIHRWNDEVGKPIEPKEGDEIKEIRRKFADKAA